MYLASYTDTTPGFFSRSYRESLIFYWDEICRVLEHAMAAAKEKQKRWTFTTTGRAMVLTEEGRLAEPIYVQRSLMSGQWRPHVLCGHASPPRF